MKKKPIIVLLLVAIAALLALFTIFMLYGPWSSAQPDLPPTQIPDPPQIVVPPEDIAVAPDDDVVIPPEDTTLPKEDTALSEEAQILAQHHETALDILSTMSTHEKICQMFIVFPECLTGVGRVTTSGEMTKTAIANYPVGGLIYNRGNMHTSEQVTKMLSDVQSYSTIPLILTCDEEGGTVTRVMSTVGTQWVDSMLDYVDLGVKGAYDNAVIISGQLKSLGFNTDLAPVADVWSNPQNTVIGNRAYSTDFQEAATLIPAAVAGFQDSGIACTLKHFPGHGDTATDSHFSSVYVDKSLETLQMEELLPFQSGIDAGADCVMIGHMIVSKLDDEPAPFSHRIVTQLLREEMGFTGIVMTDSLEMSALTQHYTGSEMILKSLHAGMDVFLGPADLPLAVDAITQAVNNGEITPERLDESVMRILMMKLKSGIIVS